jgi:MYXO-CTERM domain-containing protein
VARPFLRLLLVIAMFGADNALAYQLMGSSWDPDRGPVPYHLEPSGSDDIDDGSDLEAVRNAFRSWSCVIGSRIRFVEGEEDGVKDTTFDDGLNSVFWDETGEFGLGPATLGVAFGNGGGDGENGGNRDAAAIVFNGVDHTWSTRDDLPGMGADTDIESIAVHESGHFLGLAHSCTDETETDCLPADQSVMNPTYPGGVVRYPFEDDREGIRALYPAEDEARCDGPYRQGEICSCNGDCVSGLLCTQALDGSQICAPGCSSENVLCPVGFACVLGVSLGGGAHPGACLRLSPEGLKPPGSACDNDRECEAGLCAVADVVGRRVCRVRCESNDDCPLGTICSEEVCLGEASDGVACPGDGPPPLCGCRAASDGPTAAIWLGIAALFVIRRKRSTTGDAGQD